MYPIKLDKKKYYVVINGEEREVFPIGDFSFILELQETNFYRLEFDGEIIFKNYFTKDKEWINDFSYLDSLKASNFLEFRAKKYCDGSYTTFYNGYVNLLGKWDYDNVTFSTDIQPNDGYDVLLKNLDKKFNIKTLATIARTINSPTTEYHYNYLFFNVIYSIIANVLGMLTSSFISGSGCMSTVIFSLVLKNQ